mmetsp:Transcript_22611/g.77509  ORF Transcript_22611/g.77509 Transcript_22611/m.77509 type:complete len:293 (-) Transcript_22611:138-1016(-)
MLREARQVQRRHVARRADLDAEALSAQELRLREVERVAEAARFGPLEGKVEDGVGVAVVARDLSHVERRREAEDVAGFAENVCVVAEGRGRRIARKVQADDELADGFVRRPQSAEVVDHFLRGLDGPGAVDGDEEPRHDLARRPSARPRGHGSDDGADVVHLVRRRFTVEAARRRAQLDVRRPVSRGVLQSLARDARHVVEGADVAVDEAEDVEALAQRPPAAQKAAVAQEAAGAQRFCVGLARRELDERAAPDRPGEVRVELDLRHGRNGARARRLAARRLDALRTNALLQ